MPFATNAGVRIHYETEGSGQPLVLHHGSFASGADWRDLGRILCNTLPYLDGIKGADLLAALKDCSNRLPRETLAPFTNTPEPDRPVVIGLLSGSLRVHPVGWLTIAGFETLDPDSFEIVCLAHNASEDWMGRRFRVVAREWHDVDQLDDRA